MPMDRVSVVRLAAAVAGLENHDERIRYDVDHALNLKKNPALLREYHAVLAIAGRLELLAAEAEPVATFDVLDINDSALKVPFLMAAGAELKLMKFIRQCLGRSPIAKLEITAGRDLILHAMVYDETVRRSVLRVVESSAQMVFRRAG